MKQGLKNLSLFLCLSGILLFFAVGAKAEEQTLYQSGTDVLIGFAAKAITEPEIKSYLGLDRYNQIIENNPNWRAEDIHNFVKTLMAEDIPSDTIATIVHIFTNEFTFSQNTEDSTQTASEVFFDFATENLTNLESVLDDEGLAKLMEQTENWRAEDAQKLLDLLTEAGVEPSLMARAVLVTLGFLQRATDVFVAFAREGVGEGLESEMGEDWVSQINRYTPYLTSMEAHCFLDYLTEKIGASLTLQRIKTPSYLHDIRSCGAFKARVELFSREEYMGEERVKRKLERTLNGFNQGDLVNIENTIAKVERIIGTPNMKVFFEGNNPNISAFNVVNTEIDEIVSFLKDKRQIHPNKVVEAMLNDLVAFTRGKLVRLRSLVNEIEKKLKKYGVFDHSSNQITKLSGEEIFAKINESILRNPQAFTMGRSKNFTSLVDRMHTRLEFFGILDDRSEIKSLKDKEIYARINDAFLRNPSAFTRVKSVNLTTIETAIQNRLEAYSILDDKGEVKTLTNKDFHRIHARLNRLMLGNPQAFTMGRPANLESIVTKLHERLTTFGTLDEKGELISLTDSKIQAMINNLILRNLRAFTRGNLTNFTNVVHYLQRRGLSEALINMAMLKNLETFTRLSLIGLKALERRYGLAGLMEALQAGRLDELIEAQSNHQATQQAAHPHPVSNTQNRHTLSSGLCEPEDLLGK